MRPTKRRRISGRGEQEEKDVRETEEDIPAHRAPSKGPLGQLSNTATGPSLKPSSRQTRHPKAETNFPTSKPPRMESTSLTSPAPSHSAYRSLRLLLTPDLDSSGDDATKPEPKAVVNSKRGERVLSVPKGTSRSALLANRQREKILGPNTGTSPPPGMRLGKRVRVAVGDDGMEDIAVTVVPGTGGIQKRMEPEEVRRVFL